MASCGVRSAEQPRQAQADREHAGRRIEFSGGRGRRGYQLASFVADVIHRDRLLVVRNRASVVLQIILLVDSTLHVFPGIAGLRDLEEVPIDPAFKIKRIADRIVGIVFLIRYSRDIGRAPVMCPLAPVGVLCANAARRPKRREPIMDKRYVIWLLLHIYRDVRGREILEILQEIVNPLLGEKVQIVARRSIRTGGAGQESDKQRREMFVVDLSVHMQGRLDRVTPNSANSSWSAA